MNILLDIDGVLTDYEWFMNAYGGRYLRRRGQDGAVKNPTAYSFRDRFGCSHKTEILFFTRYLFWYAKKMPIRENAANVIHRLLVEGHQIYFVTARILAEKENVFGRLMRFYIKKWLRKNRIKYTGIFYVPLEDSGERKAELCKRLKADIFVEDDPVNIEKLRRHCRVICMEASYNQHISDVEHVVDFLELYPCIHGRQCIYLNSWQIAALEKGKRARYLCRLKKHYETMPFDFMYKKKYERFIIRAVKGFLWILKGMFRIKIKDRESLAAADSVIFICNHRSGLDIFLCYYILGRIPARFLGKREYEMKACRFFQRRAGTIFIERGNRQSGRASKNLMIHTLLNGGNILLYPEGTRNKTEAVMLPFRRGAVDIAQITGRPIIPVVIRRSGRAVSVHILEKFYVKKEDDTVEVSDCLRDRMCREYEGMGNIKNTH